MSSRPATTLATYEAYDPLLTDLLSLCTPHGQEHRLSSYIRSLPYIQGLPQELIKGNLLISVGQSETLFSAHMDMVSLYSKNEASEEEVYIFTIKDAPANDLDKLYGGRKVTQDNGTTEWKPNTLGADDKVGVYLLLKLIEQQTPGLYVFHVGEEHGGIGSKELTTNYKEKFNGYKRAIAFDRAGYSDIIEYQHGSRCCSSIFAQALATELNLYMPKFSQYKAGVVGRFTDTANYTALIAECTNISCGYFNQHGPNEYLDYIFLKHQLLPTILKLNYEALPVSRSLTDRGSPGSSYTWDDDEEWDYTKHSDINNNNSNLRKRKKEEPLLWDEVTIHTPIDQLPVWNPMEGYIPWVKSSILRKAIRKHVYEHLYKSEDRENMVDFILDFMEENSLLEEENKKLSVKLRKSGLTTDTSDDINDTYDEDMDPDVLDKKVYLRALISIGQQTQLEFNDAAYKEYIIGAERFLTLHANHLLNREYTKKEQRSFRKMIFMMTFFLSLEKTLNEEVMNTLAKIYEYIMAHIDEEGFDITPKVKGQTLGLTDYSLHDTHDPTVH